MRAPVASAVVVAVGLITGGDIPATAQSAVACTISASAVDFGTYDTISATPDDAVGTITYSCPQGAGGPGATDVIIAIDQGTSGSFNRSMTNGTDRLMYNLYTDVGRTTIWGDGSSGTSVEDDRVPPRDRPVIDLIYGRIFPKQSVGSGRYVDSLVITLHF